MKSHEIQRLGVGALALATLLGVGCASSSGPRAELAAAESALREAEAAEAPTYATAEWGRARDELADAQQAMNEENYTDARELAEVAHADAQLASAKARNESARRGNDALRGTIRELRDETERSTERLTE